MSGRASTARAVLLSWLAGNFFLGAQLAWTLRPFIGLPKLPCNFSVKWPRPLRPIMGTSKHFLPSEKILPRALE
jgi:hypothetical protein